MDPTDNSDEAELLAGFQLSKGHGQEHSEYYFVHWCVTRTRTSITMDRLNQDRRSILYAWLVLWRALDVTMIAYIFYSS